MQNVKTLTAVCPNTGLSKKLVPDWEKSSAQAGHAKLVLKKTVTFFLHSPVQSLSSMDYGHHTPYPIQKSTEFVKSFFCSYPRNKNWDRDCTFKLRVCPDFVYKMFYK